VSTKWRSELFFTRGLDTQIAKLPVGQISRVIDRCGALESVVLNLLPQKGRSCVGDVIEFVGIALGIIACLAGGVVLARRKRLARLLLEGEVASYEERKKTIDKAFELLRLKTPDRDTPFRREDLVLARAPIWLRRRLKAAFCLIGLGSFLTMSSATAIILSKQIDIEHGLGKILYDLVIAIVFGGLIGVVTGLCVDRIIKRRDDARWQSVRRLYYVAISGILGRLLNEAVPSDLKASAVSVRNPFPEDANDFKPKRKLSFMVSPLGIPSSRTFSGASLRQSH
jgi:hypothetical protein